MTPIQQRLHNIFAALNTNPSRFAADHGMSRQTMYSIASGRNEPSTGLLVHICESEPRISAEYLLRGEGEPLRDMKPSGNMETIRTLLEMQAHMNQFIEKKAKVLHD